MLNAAGQKAVGDALDDVVAAKKGAALKVQAILPLVQSQLRQRARTNTPNTAILRTLLVMFDE